MHNSRIINRYAKAFLDNSIENNKLSKTYIDCVEFLEVCSENPELLLVLLNPVIDGSKKLRITKKIFEKSFDASTLSFIILVINHGRELLLKDIFEKFINLYRENQKILEAEVFSAVPLTNDIIEKIKKFVMKITAYKTIEIKNSINEELIGGFALKYQDKLLDVTLLKKLQQLKQQISY